LLELDRVGGEHANALGQLLGRHRVLCQEKKNNKISKRT
jgi:hypothetical protein